MSWGRKNFLKHPARVTKYSEKKKKCERPRGVIKIQLRNVDEDFHLFAVHF